MSRLELDPNFIRRNATAGSTVTSATLEEEWMLHYLDVLTLTAERDIVQGIDRTPERPGQLVFGSIDDDPIERRRMDLRRRRSLGLTDHGKNPKDYLDVN